MIIKICQIFTTFLLEGWALFLVERIDYYHNEHKSKTVQYILKNSKADVIVSAYV